MNAYASGRKNCFPSLRKRLVGFSRWKNCMCANIPLNKKQKFRRKNRHQKAFRTAEGNKHVIYLFLFQRILPSRKRFCAQAKLLDELFFPGQLCQQFIPFAVCVCVFYFSFVFKNLREREAERKNVQLKKGAITHVLYDLVPLQFGQSVSACLFCIIFKIVGSFIRFLHGP